MGLTSSEMIQLELSSSPDIGHTGPRPAFQHLLVPKECEVAWTWLWEVSAPT